MNTTIDQNHRNCPTGVQLYQGGVSGSCSPYYCLQTYINMCRMKAKLTLSAALLLLTGRFKACLIDLRLVQVHLQIILTPDQSGVGIQDYLRIKLQDDPVEVSSSHFQEICPKNNTYGLCHRLLILQRYLYTQSPRQFTINTKAQFCRDNDRCFTKRVGSNIGTTFWRGSNSTWSMIKLLDTLDKQKDRTAGHSLRNNSFCKNFQKLADNQSPNQIRQLHSSIRFKKAESNRHFSTSSERYLTYLPTFEYENNIVTRTGKDKHNSRCSQQIEQLRRHSPSPILSRSNMNDVEHPTNSRSIRIINNQTTSSQCNSQHKGLSSPMDRHILQHMDQRSPIRTVSNSNPIKSDFKPQQRGDFSNSNSTMLSGPAVVYKLIDSVKL
ncbi:MAG: hypothetical protein EZS28_040490, partial [Streblomastix strix]